MPVWHPKTFFTMTPHLWAYIFLWGWPWELHSSFPRKELSWGHKTLLGILSWTVFEEPKTWLISTSGVVGVWHYKVKFNPSYTFYLGILGSKYWCLRIVVPSASLSITIKIVDLDERSYDAKAFKERQKSVGSCNKAHQWSAQIESWMQPLWAIGLRSGNYM